MHVVLIVFVMLIIVHIELVCFSTKERKQAGFVPRRRPVQLEPGLEQVPGIERMRVIEPYASGIGPSILVAR